MAGYKTVAEMSPDDFVESYVKAMKMASEEEPDPLSDTRILGFVDSIVSKNSKGQEAFFTSLATIGTGITSTVGFIGTIVAEISKIVGAIGEELWSLANNFSVAIEAGTSNLEKYLGPINARLYGLNDSVTNWYNEELPNYYTSMAEDITEAFKENSYIKQEKILENISNLVQKGIGYNIEQRAYLATIAEKTVATFNVLNDDLLNLIRLQQADVTEGAMGAEALVTHFLNSMFKDSSYINLYDTIYGAIYEANTQMSYSDSVAWTASVQTWLGSLYSVGISRDTVTKIANGLNYLATGNIKSLLSDSSLNTVFAMAAENAGISYAEILRDGLDIDNTNSLMLSMVEQLQNISSNTDNNVVKSAWSEIVGTKISDLTAISNLNSEQLAQISATVKEYTYEGAVKELENQVALLQSDLRTSLSERISNTMNNMMYSVGSTVANDSQLYGTWAKTNAFKAYYDALPIDILDIAKSINSLITGAEVTNMLGRAIARAGYGDNVENTTGSDFLDWLVGYGDYDSVDVGSWLQTYYKKAMTQEGISNKVSLNPFMWYQTMAGGNVEFSRGVETISALIEDLGTTEGIAYSTGIKGGSIGAEIGEEIAISALQSFDKNVTEAQSLSTSITSAESVSTEHTIDDLYQAIFSEDRSIRVKLVEVSDDAVAVLYSGMKLDEIGMNIEDIENNTRSNNLLDVLKQVRA